METIVVLVALLTVGYTNSQLCEPLERTIADSRMDNGRPTRDIDIMERDASILGTEGVSSGALLREFVGHTVASNYFPIRERKILFMEGVNGVGLQPWMETPPGVWDGMQIKRVMMNTSLIVSISPRHVPAATAGATTVGTAASFSAVQWRQCYTHGAISPIRMGSNEWGLACPYGTAGVNQAISLNGATVTVQNGRCITLGPGNILEGTLTPTGSMVSCTGLTTRERGEGKRAVYLKVLNTFGAHGYEGRDEDSCWANPGCYSIGDHITRTAAPLTADGVHGNIITRRVIQRFVNAWMFACDNGIPYKNETTEEVVGKVIPMLWGAIDGKIDKPSVIGWKPNFTNPKEGEVGLIVGLSVSGLSLIIIIIVTACFKCKRAREDEVPFMMSEVSG